MIYDILSKLEHYINTVPQIKTVAEALDHDDVYDKAPGVYKTPDPSVSYAISEYMSDRVPLYEVHKDTTIIYIVLSGNEIISSTWREYAGTPEMYDEETDTYFVKGEVLGAFRLSQGRFALFLPGEPFKSSSEAEEGERVKRIIFLIKEKHN